MEFYHEKLKILFKEVQTESVSYEWHSDCIFGLNKWFIMYRDIIENLKQINKCIKFVVPSFTKFLLHHDKAKLHYGRVTIKTTELLFFTSTLQSKFGAIRLLCPRLGEHLKVVKFDSDKEVKAELYDNSTFELNNFVSIPFSN